MYNDENNLYHYTYRKDGNEPGQRYDARNSGNYQGGYEPQQGSYYQSSGYQNSYQPQEPYKKLKKKRTGLKIAALALVCALLGGAAGGGIVWSVLRGGFSGVGETEVSMTARPATQVSIKTVDWKNLMTDAEVYAANVNSAVSINVTGTSGYNFFGQPVQTASSGSGFILTKDGFIVTNYHVVEGADTVKVTLYNGDTYDARYVGGEEDYDIAVIKVGATDLTPVVLGDSETLNEATMCWPSATRWVS